MTQFLIQRRLPGVQGSNGCWCDEGVIEATDEDAAITKALESTSLTINGSYWRVGILPIWSHYEPQETTEYVRTVTLS